MPKLRHKDIVKKRQFYIGGEKTFPLTIFFIKKKNDIFKYFEDNFKDFYINYTFGGYFSLLAIIDDLKLRKNRDIFLLPSYLCETMLKPFEIRQIKYDFYRVDSQLKPDFDHIKSLIQSGGKAILFIDYMGVSQKEHISPFIELFRKFKVKIIQDCVQVIDIKKNNIYGDYLFNSFRKTTPFEGSVIISKAPMNIYYNRSINFKFVFLKRVAQILRYTYLNYNFGKSSLFLLIFEKAEKFYYSHKIFKLPKLNKHLIKKIDFNLLKKRHLCAYKFLETKIPNIMSFSIKNKDFIPFGAMMISSERNKLRYSLIKNNIFCPIHWVLPLQIINNCFFEDSVNISKEILTIPLSDLTNDKLNLLVNKIREAKR